MLQQKEFLLQQIALLLWVTYRVRLCRPKLFNNLGNDSDWLSIRAKNTSSSTNGTVTQDGTMPASFVGTNTVLTVQLPSPIRSGRYLVAAYYTGGPAFVSSIQAGPSGVGLLKQSMYSQGAPPSTISMANGYVDFNNVNNRVPTITISVSASVVQNQILLITITEENTNAYFI